MPLTLYDISVPVFTRMLRQLSHILKVGEDWAKEKGIPESQVMSVRLYEDMQPLAYQVQRVSDTMKFAAVRVGGVEAPSFQDTETTWAELHDRIKATMEFLESVPKDAIAGKEDAEVIQRTPTGAERKYTGSSYLLVFAIPNAAFHVSIAYALLRHQGVPVGKMDYLGSLPQ
ncbi:hypothetical protein NA57DRAFT_54148 [Rhizodiscina lignyota]|uniref:DUF1993 domain-containing protein n=1 Tax=Rhizodiscina lignyota TaxID=1504668 RepID=A0A9P4IPM3_9PEZI|nr:hypothetical protein NA57DRAFT_54148 [Rhizodiscina lignyota]